MKFFELKLNMTLYPVEQGGHRLSLHNNNDSKAHIGILVFDMDNKLISGNAFLFFDRDYNLLPSASYNVIVRLGIDDDKMNYIKLGNKIKINIGGRNLAFAVICDIMEIR